MDIEAGEYDVFEHMRVEEAKMIKQISLEVHDTSTGFVKRKSLLAKMQDLGFIVKELSSNEVYAYGN